MVKFSKFADILNAALLQAHSIGFLNNSGGIPSPSLALLVVMLPKAHLTSCSSISGLMWVTTASSLSYSLWPFLCSSSVHSCHLFLIYLLLWGHWVFCPLLCPSLHDMFLWYLQFSWRNPYSTILLFSSNSFTAHLWGLFFISPCCSFQWMLFTGSLHSIGCIFPFLLCCSFLLFSQLFLRPPQATTLPTHICFSWGWFWWPRPEQCYKPPSIVLQATRSNPLNLFFISPI